LALARCLFWRGEYEKANQLTERADHVDSRDAGSISVAIAGSRIAVALRDFAAAVSRSAAALEAAKQLNDSTLVASAAYASAFAHLAVGDLSAVDHDVSLSLKAGRLAGDPLRTLKARLLGAEAARRRGNDRIATAVVRHAGRVTETRLT